MHRDDKKPGETLLCVRGVYVWKRSVLIEHEECLPASHIMHKKKKDTLGCYYEPKVKFVMGY